MRVPSPPSRKLNADVLLRDVRARLAERLPQLARAESDPTDPAWVLLEQAAWMVERLSDQLDQYPFAALQQMFHLLGAELQPALPALGVVVVNPAEDGVLCHSPGLPDQTRFFSAQTERVSALEFVAVEPEVALSRVELRSMCRVGPNGLDLIVPEPMDKALGGAVVTPGASRPSALFDREELRYVVQSAAGDVVEALDAAAAALRRRGLSWLEVKVEREGTNTARVTIRVAPELAVAEAIGEEPFLGGDLALRWGRLDNSDWTPELRFGALAELPPAVRGRPVPHRGQRDGLTLSDVPAGVDPAALLRRAPQPTPPEVVQEIWRTLAGRDRDRLGALRPSISRAFGGQPNAGEPTWVMSAVRTNLWAQLQRSPSIAVELRLLAGPSSAARGVRVAVATPGQDPAVAERLTAYAIDSRGVTSAEPAPARIAWQLPLPDTHPERGWVLVTALDLTLPEECAGLVLVGPDGLRAVMVNALMVAQAPAVRDGRRWAVQRNVPEPVTLLHENLLSPAVLDRLCDWSLPEATAARLRELPLAQLGVEGEGPVQDWAGVGLDAGAGQLMLNAPDERGVTRALRPGRSIELSWYRRTDGRWGNVGAGAIHRIEQELSTRPRIAAARNPLPTWHGEDREPPEAAVERLFAAQSALPVLPADFERLVLQVLGRRAPGWVVRCWTYLERTLFPWALWPLAETGAASSELVELHDALVRAGPEQVIIALGPWSPGLAEGDFAVVQREVERALAELGRRVPRLRGSLVIRLWPLVAELGADGSPWPRPELPCFGADALSATLVDAQGRRAAAPPGVQLLNAAIVSWADGAGGRS